MKIKRPILALILSAFFPGFGQIYNGHITKGLIYVCIKFAINLLRREPLETLIKEVKAGRESIDSGIAIIVFSYTLAELILWVYSMIDAKRCAEEINNRNTQTDQL